MNPILDNLNPEQKEAVKHFEGPMLVMAGAGSGKTKVLTHRIAYLIEEKNVSPYNILAITFTNKAAKEMKNRVIHLIGDIGKDMYISTFHSMCVRILRQDIDILGYKGNFVIYDDSDSLTLIKKVMTDLNFDSKRNSPKKILNIISNAKNDYLFPEDFKKRVEDEFSDMVYRIYQKYQEALMKANAVDFDDLIMLTIKLFERDETTLSFYQKKFQYILVDEYQDTNQSQFRLVKLMSEKHHNIFAVGDSDQSIYSWRGADIRNIVEFESDYLNDNKKVKVIYLEQNYRSYQSILDVANCVIQNNYQSGKYVKQLWSDKKDDDHHVVYYRAVNSDVETEFIVQKIVQKCKNDNYTLNDFAVLYRTNAMSLALEKIFNKYRIDYVIYGNVSFFDRKEIKDLVAYLRLIVNKDDDVSYLRVVNEPKRGIGKSTLEEIRTYANIHGLSLFEASQMIPNISNRAKASLTEFCDLIFNLQRKLVGDIDINDFIDEVLDDTGYLQALKLENTEESLGRIENLDEFKSLTLDLEEDLGDSGVLVSELTPLDKLCLILNNITLSSEKKQNKDNAVKIMTVHAAKGLEFPVVFIYGAEENIFPLGQDILPDDLEEERRLMYVAITRAEDELYITNAETRKIYGSYRANPESRFIREIDSDLLDYQGVKKVKKLENRNKFISFNQEENKNNEQNVKEGTNVIHARFGEGVVVKVERDVCTIAFGPAHGVKKLDINHPSIVINDKKSDNEKNVKVGSKLNHAVFGNGTVVQINNNLCTVAFEAKFGIKKVDITHPSVTLL